ncbi:hypothetical protein ACFX15_023634 [Malus domestica]
MLRCGQVAYFSPNRPLEVPDSRFGSDPKLPQQALEGQGWVGCRAVGGVQNQEHQGGALRDMTQFEASVLSLIKSHIFLAIDFELSIDSSGEDDWFGFRFRILTRTNPRIYVPKHSCFQIFFSLFFFLLIVVKLGSRSCPNSLHADHSDQIISVVHVQVGSASCGVTMLITQILWGYNAYNPDRVHGGDEVLRPW